MTRPPSLVLGVPIDDLTMAEAVEEIAALVDHGRRTGATHQVATVNVDFLVNAANDPWLNELLQGASLNLADGAPLLLAARAAGIPLRERVAGADLVPALASAAAERGWRVHFFGSAPGVAERALELLRQRHPGAHLTGTSGPYMADVTEVPESELAAIEAAEADICCVALGNPKQERFIAAHRERLGVPVMIGIGGSLDMLVGDKRRAPVWVQRAGMEWMVRAAQEPRRLGTRYARDAFVFGPRVAGSLRALQEHRTGAEIAVTTVDDLVTVTTGGDTRRGRPFDEVAREIVGTSRLEVSFAGGVPRPRALAELVGLARRARRVGVEVRVLEVDAHTSDRLRALAVPSWAYRAFEAA